MKDYTGNKYGYLTALRRVRYAGSNKGTIWLYRCDCGNEREASAKNVNAGHIKTCGKCELSRKGKAGGARLNPKENKLFQQCIRKAVIRGKKWALTTEEFSRIVHSSCSLCGKEPSILLKGTRLLYSSPELARVEGEYTPDNVISLCKECKGLKGEGRDLEQLVGHLSRILSYIQSQYQQQPQ